MDQTRMEIITWSKLGIKETRMDIEKEWEREFANHSFLISALINVES